MADKSVAEENEPDENRLEDCIETTISEWLAFNGFVYNLHHMNNLIRRLCKVIVVDTPQTQLKILIEQQLSPWRLENEMSSQLTDLNNLIRDLVDVISAAQDRIQKEGLRHAS